MKSSRGSRATQGPIHHISATQAARTFSDLLNRVEYRGERFMVERGGEAICEITPVRPYRCTGAELITVWRSLPKPDHAYWDEVEAVSRGQQALTESPWER